MTRRRLFASAGAGIAGAGALGAGWHGLAGGDGSRPRRNVLLIVVDTLRADHLGCYGARDVRTPAMDELARGAMRFTRAYPEAMPTMPARRSILTGRRIFPFRGWHPWRGLGKSAGWRPIEPDARTLASELQGAGYWAGYSTDNPFLSSAHVLGPMRDRYDRFDSIPGEATHIREGSVIPAAAARRLLPGYMVEDDAHVRHMRQYLADQGGGQGGGPAWEVPERRTSCFRTFDAAVRTLRERPRRRRFFLGVDVFDPHEPWAIPRRYRELYGDPDEPYAGDISYGDSGRMSAEELRRVRRTYAAAVSMVDAQIGRLLDALDFLKLDRDTVVALVSDHGIHLGERGWIGKSAWLLNPELIHVPLLVRDPDGAGAGDTSDWFASTHDIAPTLMSLAGVRPPGVFEGEDLSGLMRGDGPPAERPIAYGGYANDFFVRDERWALISDNRHVGEQLFDLAADPGERDEMSRRRPDVVRRMRRRLLDEIVAPAPFYSDERREAEPLTVDELV